MPPLSDPFSADSATTDGFHFDYDIDRKEQLASALLHVEEWLNDEIAALDPQIIGGTDLVAEAARWKQRFPHFRVRGTAIPRPNDTAPPDPLAVAIAAPEVDPPLTTIGKPSWAIPSSMLDWPAVAPALDWLLCPRQDTHDAWIVFAQDDAVDTGAFGPPPRIPLIELARGTDLASLQLPDPPSSAFALLRTDPTTLYFAPHTSTVTVYDLVQLLSSSSTSSDFSLFELEPTWDPTSSPLTDAVAVPILGPAAGTDTVDLAHGTPPLSAEELEQYKHHARHDSVASSLASADRLWSLSDELLSSLPDTWSSCGSWVHDDEDDDDLAAIRTAEDSDDGDDDDDGWPRPGDRLAALVCGRAAPLHAKARCASPVRGGGAPASAWTARPTTAGVHLAPPAVGSRPGSTRLAPLAPARVSHAPGVAWPRAASAHPGVAAGTTGMRRPVQRGPVVGAGSASHHVTIEESSGGGGGAGGTSPRTRALASARARSPVLARAAGGGRNAARVTAGPDVHPSGDAGPWGSPPPSPPPPPGGEGHGGTVDAFGRVVSARTGRRIPVLVARR
ncbi:hypothetical protein GGF31_006737 [Allomyces arbusculus]|nr:hypothetical protein GGF31_006737 [Allomyces arbusculus]